MIRVRIIDHRVAIESTGVYWIPTYTLLEGKVETIVANPLHIKNIPGRKNDVLDSEWIAEICLNGQIKPFYIPPKEMKILMSIPGVGFTTAAAIMAENTNYF